MPDSPVPVIDAQVHAYERDHPGRPWAAVLHGPSEVTGADMVAAMDEVGVDGALLVSPWTMYRFDASYAIDVYNASPDRFRIIKPVNPNDPDVAETIAEWASTPGAVAIRIMMVGNVSADPDDPGVNRVLSEASRNGLPVNLLCWGRLGQVAALAAANPETQLVVDHLGLQQPFEPPAPPEPFAMIDEVLALGGHENIALKITGACTLSNEPFPYPDLWEPLGRLFEAFGMDRCLWGTDWTRAVELLTYREGVEAFRVTETLSDSERAALMGGNLKRIYGW